MDAVRNVAETWPPSTSAKEKRRDRVLGKGVKHSFCCFARQRRPQQANALKTLSSSGETCGEFESKKEKGSVPDKNQG